MKYKNTSDTGYDLPTLGLHVGPGEEFDSPVPLNAPFWPVKTKADRADDTIKES